MLPRIRSYYWIESLEIERDFKFTKNNFMQHQRRKRKKEKTRSLVFFMLTTLLPIAVVLGLTFSYQFPSPWGLALSKLSTNHTFKKRNEIFYKRKAFLNQSFLYTGNFRHQFFRCAFQQFHLEKREYDDGRKYLLHTQKTSSSLPLGRGGSSIISLDFSSSNSPNDRSTEKTSKVRIPPYQDVINNVNQNINNVPSPSPSLNTKSKSFTVSSSSPTTISESRNHKDMNLGSFVQIIKSFIPNSQKEKQKIIQGSLASLESLQRRVRETGSIEIVLIAGFESFNLNLYKEASRQLRVQTQGRVNLQVYTDRDIITSPEGVTAACREADIFFGSLLFDFDQVVWLKERIKDIPVRFIFESALELMSMTEVGEFTMAVTNEQEKDGIQMGGEEESSQNKQQSSNGPPPAVKALLAKFGSNKEEDKMKGYLNFLKIGPKLLSYIPGNNKKLQDLRTWLEVYSYWNEGGIENVISMFLFLANRIGLGLKYNENKREADSSILYDTTEKHLEDRFPSNTSISNRSNSVKLVDIRSKDLKLPDVDCYDTINPRSKIIDYDPDLDVDVIMRDPVKNIPFNDPIDNLKEDDQRKFFKNDLDNNNDNNNNNNNVERNIQGLSFEPLPVIETPGQGLVHPLFNRKMEEEQKQEERYLARLQTLSILRNPNQSFLDDFDVSDFNLSIFYKKLFKPYDLSTKELIEERNDKKDQTNLPNDESNNQDNVIETWTTPSEVASNMNKLKKMNKKKSMYAINKRGDYFTDPNEYLQWYLRAASKEPYNFAPLNAPRVAILLYRKHVITGQQYIAQLIRIFESEGLLPIPIFINGVEAHTVVRDWLTTESEQEKRRNGKVDIDTLSQNAVKIDAIVNTIGFPLVGGPAGSMEAGRRVDVAVTLLGIKNVPYFVSSPLLIQEIRSWKDNGVQGLQSVVLYSLPELDGAVDTVVLGGLVGDKIALVPERVRKLTQRINGWNRIKRTEISDRKIAVLLYGFPPNVGAIGTAALLNVPQSLEKLLYSLQEDGYDIGLTTGNKINGEALLDLLKSLYQESNIAGGPQKMVNLNKQDSFGAGKLQQENVVNQNMKVTTCKVVADAFTAETFREAVGKRTAKRIEKQWGSLDNYLGIYTSSKGEFVIGGIQMGNVFIGVQPLLGIEGDPMRLLFERDLTPHPQYVAFYQWIRKNFMADAVVHFGMHGTVEWLPGSPLGNTAETWPDILMGDIPNIYLYACNNPSESILAKRRGYGTIISHNVPAYARAGLYKDLVELRELLQEYRENPESNSSLKPLIVGIIDRCSLFKDVPFDETKYGYEVTPGEWISGTLSSNKNDNDSKLEKERSQPESAANINMERSSESNDNPNKISTKHMDHDKRITGGNYPSEREKNKLQTEGAESIPDFIFMPYAINVVAYLQLLENRLFSEGLHILGSVPSSTQIAQYLDAYFGDRIPKEIIQILSKMDTNGNNTRVILFRLQTILTGRTNEDGLTYEGPFQGINIVDKEPDHWWDSLSNEEQYAYSLIGMDVLRFNFLRIRRYFGDLEAAHDITKEVNLAVAQSEKEYNKHMKKTSGEKSERTSMNISSMGTSSPAALLHSSPLLLETRKTNANQWQGTFELPLSITSRARREKERKVKEDLRKDLLEAIEIVRLLKKNTEEIDSIKKALNGEYVLPGVGGDLLRDGAGVLPTGRNIHALDPYRLPSPAAWARGSEAARKIIDVHKKANNGAYPETVAVTLWGLDVIKTKGESIAILLELVGARPVKEATGRVVRYDLIPLEQLGRPRIDVLASLSGIFRDSFANIVDLLDDLFERAANAEGEDVDLNFIRKHYLELKSNGVPRASSRLFSNPAGDYGSLVNERIGNGDWENEDELGATWESRNTFSYGKGDEKGTARPEVLQKLLESTSRIVQEIDSVEYGLSDIQEYYANTGALKKAATMAKKSMNQTGNNAMVAVSIIEAFSADVTPKELDATLRLEYRSKLLNPKWAKSMANQGSGGAYEISQRMTALLGWSSTCDFTDKWVYDGFTETYVLDEEMCQQLRKNNPEAFRNILKRLLEANGRGYWVPPDNILETLQEMYEDVEDEVEFASGDNPKPLKKVVDSMPPLSSNNLTNPIPQ